jgi:arylsulfatase A-like enzyme
MKSLPPRNKTWIVASLLALTGPAFALAADRSRPNVLLIITDDQGYGDMACHGNPIIKTPEMDRLHAQSVRLTNYHVDPTCSPTRSALMTGRYSSRGGVWHTVMGRSILRRDERTMADVFAANGYKTGMFGKWHLGDNYPYRPEDRGFGEVLTHGGGGIGNTPDYWGNNYFDDTLRHNGAWEKQMGYCTDVFFSAATKFIESNKDAPFFCYLATNAPHAPYNVAEKYSKPYVDLGVPQPRANFYGMIACIDENLGRLMTRLKELGIEENTIVLFMTDNGSAIPVNDKKPDGFAAGMRGFKGSEYDGGHRTPCFFRWLGTLKGGRDVTHVTAHIDVLPTLIDLCGLKKPDVEFDGRSLRPLLEAKGDWPERTLFVHSQRIDHPEKWRKCAVMTDRWRLVNGEKTTSPALELFDMSADPGQLTDLAKQKPEVVKQLRSAYDDWWSNISKRFGEYTEIVIGSDKANPVPLFCHDWHGEKAPSLQDYVRKKDKCNGFWAIEVVTPGKYEVTLREQPAVAKFPIEGTTARLKVGDTELTKPISANATEIVFPIELKAGKTRLQTWFADKDGDLRGAFFVEVKRLKRD